MLLIVLILILLGRVLLLCAATGPANGGLPPLRLLLRYIVECNALFSLEY